MHRTNTCVLCDLHEPRLHPVRRAGPRVMGVQLAPDCVPLDVTGVQGVAPHTNPPRTVFLTRAIITHLGRVSVGIVLHHVTVADYPLAMRAVEEELAKSLGNPLPTSFPDTLFVDWAAVAHNPAPGVWLLKQVVDAIALGMPEQRLPSNIDVGRGGSNCLLLAFLVLLVNLV